LTRAARRWGRVLRRRLASTAVLTAALVIATRVRAQELEPRSYSASPVGANFASVSYAYSSGDVLFDPTVPITNARAWLSGASLGYGRTFGIGRFQALALIGLPYGWGWFSGTVGTSDSTTTRAGPGDVRAKLSINLIGPPAMAPAEFARTPHSPWIAGASLAVSAPTGQYNHTRLINIGAHRWSFKPEVGVSYNWRARWFFETYGGVTFFADNDAFYPGAVRLAQDPLTSVQAHASYTIAPRTWAALESTWYAGGATRSNGGAPTARQDNTRVGALLAIGITPRQSLKLGYSFGSSIRVGQSFRTAALSYQVLWF
jgi:hypothetical protein